MVAVTVTVQQKVLRPVIRLLNKYKLVMIGEARISQRRTGALAPQAKPEFCLSSKKGYYFSGEKTKISPLK